MIKNITFKTILYLLTFTAITVSSLNAQPSPTKLNPPERVYITVDGTPQVVKMINNALPSVLKELNLQRARNQEDAKFEIAILGAGQGATGAISFSYFRLANLDVIEATLNFRGERASSEWLKDQRLGVTTNPSLYLMRLQDNEIQSILKRVLSNYYTEIIAPLQSH